MNIIFAQQPLPKSIFLAGPTPRNKETPSWRPDALAILRDLDFKGTVYVPEQVAGGLWEDRYSQQVCWEWEALNISTVVVFWVPRDLAALPGFTTNTEFGLQAASSKAVLGYPRGAAKMRYLQHLAQRYHIPTFRTLEQTLAAGVAKAYEPFPVQADTEPF